MKRVPSRLWWARALAVSALGAVASGAVGCAEERPPINQVQANALAKSFFVGADLQSAADDPEFWAQGTLVDVGYGAAQDGLFTSTYAQPLSRIKWEITEDMLIGRITYERINDSDGKGKGAQSMDGQIAYMYPIMTHFDIRRAYNPGTGEELNVVTENMSDRPWYEREYFRVDWSRNLFTDAYDFDTLSMMGLFGGIQYEPVSYWVADPNHPDAPVFDTESGYFDITNKAFAAPKQIDLSKFGWGIDSFPACYLDADFMNGSAPYGNCNPVEITIRQSFRRVVDTDYQPREWDGYRFQAYGSFYVERTGYARNYGMVDEKWHRLATHYNIWERSHYYDDPEAMTGEVACNTEATTPYGKDANRDDDANGTDDECESVTAKSGFSGSTCDIFKKKCTLPYRARTPKANVWYYSTGSNLDFWEGTRWATHEWDVALRAAVQTAQYAECQRAGEADCATKYPVYTGQQADNEVAILVAREVDDCRDGLTGDGTGCEAKGDALADKLGAAPAIRELAKMEQMVVLCHSPVEAGDPALCGEKRLAADLTAQQCADARINLDEATIERCKEGLDVRMGDLRYHQVNVMKAPQTPSPWGIYTDSEDPLTGEKVAASINIWSHVNDLWSQGVVDQLRYIKGELTTAEVTEAAYVKNWAAASESAAGGNAAPLMSKAEITERARAIAASGRDLTAPNAKGVDATKPTLGASKLSKEHLAAAYELKKELMQVKADSREATSVMAPIYEARRQKLKGSTVEAELMTPAMQQYAGVEGMAMTDGVMDFASPIRALNPSIQRQLRHMKENALADRGACILEAPAPNGMTALADLLEAKFGAFNPSDDEATQAARAERMRKYMAQRAQYAVIIHEMGHSVGLRHNFVSSSDAWGFRPQYWQLRTLDGSVTDVCDDVAADGASCVGPRYYDPMTQHERDNLLWMFMHHSVMEYAGENTQDFLGLGAYDFAAARMFYGDVVAVHGDASYNVGTARGRGIIEKMDSFGGILGIQPVIGNASGTSTTDIHYSQLQNEYELIKNCKTVNPEDFKPSDWNDELYGTWHPVLDGLIVPQPDGTYTRCEQQPVDYVQWRGLRFPKPGDGESGDFYRGGPSVDSSGRTRVPYGFATDRWADLGNLSVYRHDNGADPYELFNFFIAQQEIGHIFDYYRRGRQSFSVRNATSRNLGRFNEKMRDGAKGLGLLTNIYRDFWLEIGLDFESAWEEIGPVFFKENVVASGIAFDHFARMLARPEAGEHFRISGDPVLRSSLDTWSQPGPTRVVVPNGATGFYGNVGWGGKLMENRLCGAEVVDGEFTGGCGEYDAEYTINAGAYYDKVWVGMLMTESFDNFISDSRQDFVDSRYRAVSLADLFPDGYRRMVANALTGDDFIKGPRLASANGSNSLGNPLTDEDDYPQQGIGWTSWWHYDQPRSCFPVDGSIVCEVYDVNGQTATPNDLSSITPGPTNTTVLDPQIGWEQQKFLIAMTLLYLPENQKQNWMNLLQVWELGTDNDPEIANRIEFHHPSGKVYVARTYGTETIFGKTVQKGIGARVLEYANELLAQAYVTTTVTQNGVTWYLPEIDQATGAPLVKPDAAIQPVSGAACDNTAGNLCNCADNRACVALEKYVSVPRYISEAMTWLDYGVPGQKGVYN